MGVVAWCGAAASHAVQAHLSAFMRQVERQRAREGLTVILSVTLARDRTQSGARERAGDPALGASAPPPAHPARAQTRSAAKRKQSVDRSKHTKQRAPDREKNGVGETEENLRIRLSGIGTSSEDGTEYRGAEMEKEGKTKEGNSHICVCDTASAMHPPIADADRIKPHTEPGHVWSRQCSHTSHDRPDATRQPSPTETVPFSGGVTRFRSHKIRRIATQ